VSTYPDDEAVLTAGYEEEARLYARALELAEPLPGLLREGKADGRLPQILGLFVQISEVEARLAAAKSRWERNGGAPGAALRLVKEQLTALMEKLLGHIRLAEQETLSQRDRLLPELDALVRARRMQQAYRRRS
jgi:hypothetical protein